MGANKSKQTEELTSAKLITITHPTSTRKIQKCMKKWHQMTSGKSRWPLEGSFDPRCCDMVEEGLRNKDRKYDATHLKKKLKNAEHRDILQYFRLGASQSPVTHRDTDLRPPP